jgi:hypothetical protein
MNLRALLGEAACLYSICQKSFPVRERACPAAQLSGTEDRAGAEAGGAIAGRDRGCGAEPLIGNNFWHSLYDERWRNSRDQRFARFRPVSAANRERHDATGEGFRRPELFPLGVVRNFSIPNLLPPLRESSSIVFCHALRIRVGARIDVTPKAFH